MNNTFNPWKVQVTGSASALEHLVTHFIKPPLRFSAGSQPGQVEFQSESFLACSTVSEIRAIATRELHVISGVLATDERSSDLLQVGAVIKNKPGGGRDVFVTAISATVTIGGFKVTAVGTVTDINGNKVVVEPPPPRTIALAALALADKNVGKAMRLVTADDFRTWVGLYRLHEVIESDVGGMHPLTARGWGSATDLRRFKHSANSVAVGGDASRHGKELTTPPAHPMSIDEADRYVRYILESWLADKMRAMPDTGAAIRARETNCKVIPAGTSAYEP
jgi:hypothetical protein